MRKNSAMRVGTTFPGSLPAVAGLLLLPMPLVAEEQPLPLKAPIGGFEVLSLGISLVVVIGAILLLGWLYARTQGMRGAASESINIVASRSLGPKERIFVVDIAGKQIVVGMTATQMGTLCELDTAIVGSSTVTAGGTFADRLRSAISGSRK